MPEALVERDPAAVVDRLQGDAAVSSLGNIANQVKDGKHGLLVIWLTRERVSSCAPGEGESAAYAEKGAGHGRKISCCTVQQTST